MAVSEIEFKKKELERLLREKKIDVNQYLETLAKMEQFSSKSEVKSLGHEQIKKYTLTGMHLLLIASPFLILMGWFIANLNPISAYTLDHSKFIPGVTCYPYSPLGLGIMMTSIILLSVGITSRWVKKVSRGDFIVLEVTGWFFVSFALYSLVSSISMLWIPVAPNSWQSFVSIHPTSCILILIFWFIGVFMIIYGLTPLRKWFNKSIV